MFKNMHEKDACYLNTQKRDKVKVRMKKVTIYSNLLLKENLVKMCVTFPKLFLREIRRAACNVGSILTTNCRYQIFT